MIVTTKEQRQALKRAWIAQAHECVPVQNSMYYLGTPQYVDVPTESYLAFRRRFKVTGGGSDLYLFGQVPAGFWLGIERDGYTHT